MHALRIPSDLRALTDKGLVKAVVVTYGVLHGRPPRPSTGHTVHVDLTSALRNPADDPRLIQMTGLDHPVRQHVLNTPGARAIIDDALERTGRALIAAAHARHLTEIFVFCKGGRHRSVAIGEEIAAALRANGVNTEVEHRDMRKPVVK
ncbi:RapZ C-terminal domain-containing protein [Nocardiopsis protaetiae]|uniref:RapZ C-terminal domain-containing protein n=1 Tax=Nocardiopsis protaetiae TaxID=3382270 RepID=UPI00387B9B24